MDGDSGKTLKAKFEVTETTLTDIIKWKIHYAVSAIINGGYINILCNEESDNYNTRTKYIKFSGNAQADFDNFGVSSTTDGNYSVKVPVFNITGGRIDTLSSTYLNSVSPVSNNVYFYIDSGYINNFYTT